MLDIVSAFIRLLGMFLSTHFLDKLPLTFFILDLHTKPRIINKGVPGLPTGPRLNIKTVLSTYGDFHVKDKTVVRTSYL